MAPLPLPAGWLVRVSRSKGKTYYINTFTKATQWTRPTEPAEPDQTSLEASPASKRQRVEEEDEKPKDAGSVEAAITRCMRVGAMLSPWPHQVNAVQKLLTAITSDDRATGVETFLLQHSTGSGKTVTMAALAHQLLYAVDSHGSRFHTVVVLIDRIKLDEQVGGAIEQFLRRNGIHEVFRAESIDHLAKLLDPSQQAAEQRVIITSIQKLGLLVKDPVLVTRLLHRSTARSDEKKFDRIAIITDEAHRSHTASTREAIQEVIKAGEGNDTQMTFVGVTATPNIEALHLFGSKVNEYRLGPFDCYSIALATKDGRIMNILENYKCIRCDVETTIPPSVIETLRKKGNLRAILDYASDELTVLKAKSLLMMEDFEEMKSSQPRAKCMIVARSRRDVLRYYRLVSAYTANRALAWKIYASFSGTLIEDDDKSASTISEQGLNGPHLTLAISDIVIVCDKLDTGYNDPLLACMYIDRSLRSSSQTVQLLSRLNRRHKAKKRIRIVDFANHPAQIRRSFADYWKETQAPHASDVFDFEAEQMNLLTGVTILCDFFPIMWDSPTQTQVQALVKDHILQLERDAFQQVSSALRVAISAWKRLETENGDFTLHVLTPIRFDMLTQLKKEIEAQTNSDQDLDHLDQIKTKMSSRVSHYEPTFSGSIYPQSLLDLAEWKPSSSLSNQLEYGPLEIFEICIAFLARKDSGENAKTSMGMLERIKSRCASMKSSRCDEQAKIFKQLEVLLSKLTEKK